MGPRHDFKGMFVDGLPVVEREPLAVETEELPQHLDQPTVLDRVLQRLQVLDQAPHFLAWRKLRLLDRLAGEAGRMSQLRVVVIAEHVGERGRRRRERVDVRMRIDDDERVEFGV